MDTNKKTYDIQDIIDTEITLEPLKCRYCGKVGETTYHPGVGDAYCEICGRWQLDS